MKRYCIFLLLFSLSGLSFLFADLHSFPPDHKTMQEITYEEYLQYVVPLGDAILGTADRSALALIEVVDMNTDKILSEMNTFLDSTYQHPLALSISWAVDTFLLNIKVFTLALKEYRNDMAAYWQIAKSNKDGIRSKEAYVQYCTLRVEHSKLTFEKQYIEYFFQSLEECIRHSSLPFRHHGIRFQALFGLFSVEMALINW
jgi:hypothetical protein